jgi:hypothetical protein
MNVTGRGMVNCVGRGHPSTHEAELSTKTLANFSGLGGLYLQILLIYERGLSSVVFSSQSL